MLHVDLTLPITNPVLIVALVMLVVLLAPLLFARLRIPGMVGLIVAGILIGPHSLGLLERDLTIRVLGTIGLLYIMFLAGLEVNLNEFAKYRSRSILFGTLSFALPQFFGTMMSLHVLGFDLPQAILLGSVLASHTLLAYPLISRLGLAKTQAVTTAVGGTILTDTVALLVLAVIARSTGGEAGPLFWVLFTLLLGLYTVAVMWGLPRLARWFFRTVRAGEIEDFVFVLTAVFASAFLAEVAGVEAIIGAFLSGLALNRLIPEHSTLMNRVRFFGESMFIPFFLISVGMLVNLRVLAAGPGAWLVACSMLVTVVSTKWLAAMATRPLFGYSADQGWMLFGLTVPQAAATLAAALIGFNLGLFDESVLNGTILMIMVTCMLGPWVAERHGRRVVLQMEQEPLASAETPQRILVPLANPETAPLLMDVALMIRDAGHDQPIFPLTVARDGSDVEASVSAGERLLGHAVVHAAAAAVPVIPVTRIDHNVARGIHRAVKECQISTVVVGWNGIHTARQFIFGSVLDQLLAETQQMVLVSKIEQPLGTLRRMLLAVPPHADREPGFQAALRTAKTLAAHIGADLLILAAEGGLPRLQEWVEQTRPAVRTAYRPLGSWDQVIPTLEAVLEADDLLALFAAREGTIAWRPALDRLPRLVTQRFPSVNLLVAYPPEATLSGAAGVYAGHLQLPRLLQEANVRLSLPGDTPADVLYRMLAPELREQPETLDRAVRILSEIPPEEVPELSPGVVLYHTHLQDLERPMLFVGISEAGIRLPSSAYLVHVVLVLLNPERTGPDEHLRRLGVVARLFRASDIVDQLRAAASEEGVKAILQSSVEAPRTAEELGK